MKWILQCVLWINFLYLTLLTEALKVGETGVCTATISVPKTRPKWVTLNKMCGKKKCTQKRIVKYSVTQQKTICCSGWVYNSNDTCTPICQYGCQGGRCTAPDVCTCDPPMTPHPDHSNVCLAPKCDPPCVNADCVNNTCHCNPGFQIYNSTHCTNCRPGFTTTEDLKCSPICKDGCLNGRCTGPDECTCAEGYEKDEDVCVPICLNPCENGKCTDPDICTCDEGYQKDGIDNCEPICTKPCSNGKCTEPNVCTCDPGYEKNSTDHCEPKCDQSCTNGKCIAPNLCTCEPGYEKNSTDHCEPKCDQSCTNGKCIAPNLCTCEPGYEKNSTDHCEPICDEPCRNGRCTAPNICTCDRGYKKTVSDICEPICECVNATCTAPNNCTCFDGFEKVNDTVCMPKCDNCGGECVEPNVCVCVDGFVNIHCKCKAICGDCVDGHCDGKNCVCNEGFVADADDPKRCVRDCTKPIRGNQTDPKKFNKKSRCPKGYKDCTPKERNELGNFDPKKFRCCSPPKLVVCCEGYEFNNGSCYPMCKPACQHGTCVLPDVCECDPLYSWHDKKCIPSVCDPPCGDNTICTNDTCNCVEDTLSFNATHCAPKCETGYEPNKLSLVCEPVCESGCQNGVCESPNVCTCNDGYKLDNNTCIPVCSDCANGKCIAPNVCQCHEPEYTKHQNGSCVPVCAEGCINADCTAPNFCTCHGGYDKTDPGNQFACQPICTPECVNATCASPNNCNCFDGYENIGNEWSCARKCDDGYVRNASNPSVCYKPCKGRCDFGVCTRDGVCECRSGYELANDTCSPLPPVDCSTCEHNCSDGECWCLDRRPCTSTSEVGAEVTSTGLAAMEWTWVVGGALLILLLALVVVVMHQLYKRRSIDAKAAASDPYGTSIVYTVPDTLRTKRLAFGEANEATEATLVTEADEVEAVEREAPRANANAEPLLSEEKHCT